MMFEILVHVYHYCLGVCAKQLKQGRKGSEYKRKEKKRKPKPTQKSYFHPKSRGNLRLAWSVPYIPSFSLVDFSLNPGNFPILTLQEDQPFVY
jgi:hypothetical protein